jgi:superfamily II DNA or RNA helicase
MAEKPSDLGDKDEGFILPPFQVFRHRARDSHISRDLADMFGAPALSATNVYAVKRQTSEARAELAASIVASEPDKIWLIWVDTDNEGDAMLRALPSAIEVRGSQSADEKEAKLEAFSSGTIRQFISKPSLSGFGMDWSHCARMVFVGRTYSYETWYQAVRRCWRFGQKETVVIHLVVAEGESEIGRVIDRKAGDHIGMKSAMRAAMNRSVGKTSTVKSPYEPLHQARIAPWISDV